MWWYFAEKFIVSVVGGKKRELNWERLYQSVSEKWPVPLRRVKKTKQMVLSVVV
jgi:hypothetical protein